MDIVLTLSNRFQMSERTVNNLIRLLDDDMTIPFIARYRKDQTNGADEVEILEFQKALKSLRALVNAQEKARMRLEKLGVLTPELEQAIDMCRSASEVSDLLTPYSKDRKTKAGMARERGYQEAADIIMGRSKGNLKKVLSKLGGDLDAALDIVAEESVVHPRAKYTVVSELLFSRITVKLKEEVSKYASYVKLNSRVDHLKGHQIHALFRGERDGLLSFSFDYNFEKIVRTLLKHGSPPSKYRKYYEMGLERGLKRLLIPRSTRTVRKMLKEKADRRAIEVFEMNLLNLLLTPPIEPEPVLALDPGYKTGAKVAVVDASGDLLDTAVIYPVAPHNKTSESTKILRSLIERHGVEFVVVGDGTASKETAQFVQSHLPEVRMAVVSEVGASVYSASKIAREEFPDLEVEMRSAVSIARRVLDPLAEYVKIDPKSLGVGQYQHDVDQKMLDESLRFTVSRAVNRYGLSTETASASALTYVSGIGEALAKRIVDYRKKNSITTRRQLLKISGIGKQKYQQCSGFLRVPHSEQLLDRTMIHPDDYELAERMVREAGTSLKKLEKMSSKSRRKVLSRLKVSKYTDEEIGEIRIKDIIEELVFLGIDRRGVREFHDIVGQVESLDDLKIGKSYYGKVSNVTDFGAFINLGIKENGLVHKSHLADRFIQNVYSVVKVGDFVKTEVIDIDMERRRISLKLLEVNGKRP